MVKKLLIAIFLLVVGVTPAFAAVPDGPGPWADTVVGFTQGLTKAGGAIPAGRSDPTAALGVAEDDTVEPHFVSLGFGGVLTLGFDNGFQTAVVVVEATNPGYPTETATVEVSADGTAWVSAGSLSQDGNVTVPSSVDCAKYVRITDTSVAANFSEDTADGYDVDGVQVTGDTCTPPPCSGKPDCGCTPTNIVISGNGNNSTNTVVVTKVSAKVVTQTNKTNVATAVKAKANTGKNTVSKNTGGSSIITTGGSLSLVSISTTGGINKLKK